MSYEFEIGEESFGYTYNVAPMWYACYPLKGIRALNGFTGTKSIPLLRKLREHMEDNKEACEAVNPENGWGDYESALLFISKLIGAALRYPTEVWFVE